tara:strand:- start:69 stop:899 length:831 start_codon:yes stop_codon:yes gene_type:complete
VKNNFFFNSIEWRVNITKNFLKKLFLRETIEISLINQIVKKENKLWILDIGANIGQKTELFLSANSKINIMLFEPYKKYFLYIKKKFKKKKNIKFYNFGIGKRNKKQKFYTTNQKENSEAFSFRKMPYHNSSTKSEVRKLDNLKVLKNKKILLIKIDVEQLELDVMIGGKKLLIKNRPFLLFETTNKNINKIKIFLQRINYSLYAYEYFIFRDNSFVFRNPIKSWQESNLIKSNIYEKKLYEINAFKNKKSYMLNLFALPKERNYITTKLDIIKKL